MDVAVQWVRVYWTRRSRGAPGAVRRNSLPEAFPLPDGTPPFVHEVHMYEGEDFIPESSLTSGLPPVTQLELAESRGILRVMLVPQMNNAQARTRLEPAWRRMGVPLRRRHTLRWHINYRFMAEWGWYYRLDTLNIVYGTFSGEVFVHHPVRRIDERRQFH
ncbi:hypothetical protein [Actinomadura rubrisoli]|uniref:Uncharacterized protein n=1 Tax=Actinomadura rubrisoli TaxID=2530368 RepID=A0A4V2YXF7_9ACTN|nr:hypothetical protein [Actinomadura rubrisoli]TDD89267.1 hypothetical protein E1298_14320 [Actinomadura rubrisoli]